MISSQKFSYTEAAERSPKDLPQNISPQFLQFPSSAPSYVPPVRTLIFVTDELFGMTDTCQGVKVQFPLEQAMKAQRGSRGIAPLFL